MDINYKQTCTMKENKHKIPMTMFYQSIIWNEVGDLIIFKCNILYPNIYSIEIHICMYVVMLYVQFLYKLRRTY